MFYTLLSIATILIPFIIGSSKFKLLDEKLRILFLLVITSMIADIFNIVLYYVESNSRPVKHTYSIIEVALIGLFYYKIFSSTLSKGYILICSILFLIFSVTNLIVWESILEPNDNQSYFAHIMIVSLVFIYFYEIFKNQNISRLEKEPSFIISATFLIYFAGTLFIHITRDIMTAEDFVYYYYKIHSTLHIFFNLGIALAFWIGAKKNE